MRLHSLLVGVVVAVWGSFLLYAALLVPPVILPDGHTANAVVVEAVDLLAFLQGRPSDYESGEFLPAVVTLVFAPSTVLFALLAVRGLAHRVVAMVGGVLLAAGVSHLFETLKRVVSSLVYLSDPGLPGSPDPGRGIGNALQSATGNGQIGLALALMVLTVLAGVVSARLVSPDPREPAHPPAWWMARAGATWAVLPMIVLCFVGGFSTRSRGIGGWETDWATSGLPASLAEFFFEYRIGPLAGGSGIRNRNPGDELMYLLPALVTALTFLVLVWLVVAWFVRGLHVGTALDAATGVVSVWAVVTLVSTVVAGVAEAIVVPPELRFGLGVTIDGLRFGVVWGWLAGIGAVLAMRTAGRSSMSSGQRRESEVVA